MDVSSSRTNFFPVFIGMATVVVSMAFYGVMNVGVGLGQQTDAEVLGVSDVIYTATVKVRDNVSTKYYENVTFESGDTVYDLLLETRRQTSFDFGGDMYDFGYYIHTINGRRSLNNEYWKFTLNSADSAIRMEKYEIQEGDIIGFELDKF